MNGPKHAWGSTSAGPTRPQPVMIDLTASSDDESGSNQHYSSIVNANVKRSSSSTQSLQSYKRSRYHSPPRLPVASSSRLPSAPSALIVDRTIFQVQHSRNTSISSNVTHVPETVDGNSSFRSDPVLSARATPKHEVIVISDSDEDATVEEFAQYEHPADIPRADDRLKCEVIAKANEFAKKQAMLTYRLNENQPAMKRTNQHLNTTFGHDEEDDYLESNRIFEGNVDPGRKYAVRTQVEALSHPDPLEPPEDMWNEVTERLRHLRIDKRWSKEDVLAIEAFGREPLLVASGAKCPKLELYERSQPPRFPLDVPELARPGFHLTGRFTGARPYPRGSRPPTRPTS